MTTPNFSSPKWETYKQAATDPVQVTVHERQPIQTEMDRQRLGMRDAVTGRPSFVKDKPAEKAAERPAEHSSFTKKVIKGLAAVGLVAVAITTVHKARDVGAEADIARQLGSAPVFAAPGVTALSDGVANAMSLKNAVYSLGGKECNVTLSGNINCQFAGQGYLPVLRPGNEVEHPTFGRVLEIGQKDNMLSAHKIYLTEKGGFGVAVGSHPTAQNEEGLDSVFIENSMISSIRRNNSLLNGEQDMVLQFVLTQKINESNLREWNKNSTTPSTSAEITKAADLAAYAYLRNKGLTDDQANAIGRSAFREIAYATLNGNMPDSMIDKTKLVANMVADLVGRAIHLHRNAGQETLKVAQTQR